MDAYKSDTIAFIAKEIFFLTRFFCFVSFQTQTGSCCSMTTSSKYLVCVCVCVCFSQGSKTSLKIIERKQTDTMANGKEQKEKRAARFRLLCS